MRVDGWERRLKLAVEKHMALPSEYGVSDCFLIVRDCVEACTGEVIYPSADGYKTPAGIAKKLMQHGFETMEDALRAKFPVEIAPAMAQRGDVGVVERSGVVTGGVFTQLGFFTRGEGAAEFLPIADVKTAFKVR